MTARHTVLCGALYTACVDTSRTVYWDRSELDFETEVYCSYVGVCDALNYHLLMVKIQC